MGSIPVIRPFLSNLECGYRLMVNSLPSKQIIWVQFPLSAHLFFDQGVAQPGSVPVLGAGCRWFKSSHPDFYIYIYKQESQT